MKKIGMAILGCGTVGSEVVRLLGRAGKGLELVGIAVRSRNKRRSRFVPRRLLTTRAERLVKDPRVSIVVELIGGTGSALRLQQTALQAGKSVVTANKALIDAFGDRIFSLARRHGAHVAFEASVGGGIPIIRALTEGLAGNRFRSVAGIINGTTNYILSRMAGAGLTFKAALAEARRLGYAEADSTLDIDGHDAAQKLAILIRLAFGGSLPSRLIPTRGIAGITPVDLECARRFGFVIKSVAMAKSYGQEVEAHVAPTMIPRTHPLAAVDGAANAIAVRGDAVGEVVFSGQGAGGPPTASAVVSDILSVADRIRGGLAPLQSLGNRRLILKNPGSIRSEYYLRFTVTDRPGVLARIAGVLGRHGISISSVYQHGQDVGGKVPIIILTHAAMAAGVQQALVEINRMSFVRAATEWIRIERAEANAG